MSSDNKHAKKYQVNLHCLNCSYCTSKILKHWCAGGSTVKFSFNYSDNLCNKLGPKKSKKETEKKPKRNYL